jgi:hypothetical protein
LLLLGWEFGVGGRTFASSPIVVSAARALQGV